MDQSIGHLIAYIDHLNAQFFDCLLTVVRHSGNKK